MNIRLVWLLCFILVACERNVQVTSTAATPIAIPSSTPVPNTFTGPGTTSPIKFLQSTTRLTKIENINGKPTYLDPIGGKYLHRQNIYNLQSDQIEDGFFRQLDFHFLTALKPPVKILTSTFSFNDGTSASGSRTSYNVSNGEEWATTVITMNDPVQLMGKESINVRIKYGLDTPSPKQPSLSVALNAPLTTPVTKKVGSVPVTIVSIQLEPEINGYSDRSYVSLKAKVKYKVPKDKAESIILQCSQAETGWGSSKMIGDEYADLQQDMTLVGEDLELVQVTLPLPLKEKRVVDVDGTPFPITGARYSKDPNGELTFQISTNRTNEFPVLVKIKDIDWKSRSTFTMKDTTRTYVLRESPKDQKKITVLLAKKSTEATVPLNLTFFERSVGEVEFKNIPIP